MRTTFWRGEGAIGVLLVTSYLIGLAGYLFSLPGLTVLAAVVLAGAIIYLIDVLARMRAQGALFDGQSRRLDEAVSVVRLLENQLRHQGMHDSLTGLPNRSLLDDRLEHALRGSERSGRDVAALICDLDGFKNVNDSFGHHTGDKLLAVVAKRISSVVRTGDTVARMGGDEFAIVMADIEDPSVARAVAERVVAAVRRPINIGELPIMLSTSVGLAQGGASSSAEVLLSEADAAMYSAKSSGKDRVVSFQQPMRTAIVRRMGLRNAFAEALQDGEFRLVYQPQMSLPEGRLEGFEALVRWRHPQFGEIEPEEFIPLAEETGFIVPLGRWVLETACLAAAMWQDLAPGVLSMSVNVSGRQLQSKHFVDDLQAALSYSGLAPAGLVLEATESVLMADTEESAGLLHRIRKLGVQVAIDDFGTGYSSLSYLSQFPIDVLKIDKTFVDPLDDPSGNAVTLVSAIHTLAEQLNMSTVAEGIETDQQLRTLLRVGYTSGQGDLLSKPLDQEAAAALVRAAATGAHQADVR